jgi:uncharacterized cupin superfamily protein
VRGYHFREGLAGGAEWMVAGHYQTGNCQAVGGSCAAVSSRANRADMVLAPVAGASTLPDGGTRMNQTGRRHPQVVNISEVEEKEMRKGRMANRSRRLGAAAGGVALGCTHLELAPGDTSYPYHFHSAQEEALYVLEGSGTLRIGTQEVAVGAGDYVALPAGPEFTHALKNNGGAPLRYLALSGPATRVNMDIIGYPDSKKIAFSSGVTAPGKAWLRKMIKDDQPSVDYFEDEPLASE